MSHKHIHKNASFVVSSLSEVCGKNWVCEKEMRNKKMPIKMHAKIEFNSDKMRNMLLLLLGHHVKRKRNKYKFSTSFPLAMHIHTEYTYMFYLRVYYQFVVVVIRCCRYCCCNNVSHQWFSQAESYSFRSILSFISFYFVLSCFPLL